MPVRFATDVTRFLCKVLMVSLALLGTVQAQQRSMGDINSELMRMETDSDGMRATVWLAAPFWRFVLEQSKMPPAQVDSVVKLLDRYVLIVVVDGRKGPVGALTFTSGDDLRSKVTIRGAQGAPVKPLPESALDRDTSLLISTIRPQLASMMGEFGKGFNIFAFPAKNTAGNIIADPTKEGQLVVGVDMRETKYRLPLGIALPPRFDPVTGEQFPGNYRYNPFIGRELETHVPARTGN